MLTAPRVLERCAPIAGRVSWCDARGNTECFWDAVLSLVAPIHGIFLAKDVEKPNTTSHPANSGTGARQHRPVDQARSDDDVRSL